MKLSDILLLTLFFVMGAMIFAIKQMQANVEHLEPSVPVPAVKPQAKAVPETSLPQLRLDMSGAEQAGSYGRLSLDEFLAKDSPDTTIRQTAPRDTATQTPPANSVIKRPRKRKGDQAGLFDTPAVQFSNLQFETAEPINLAALPSMDDVRFMDQVVEMAQASPVQPDSRGCGTLKNTLKSGQKHAKVRSVGLARQLTDRTSIGVEYVYKDGCYKSAIAPLQSLNMPSDDGVNLRVNMRF